MALSAPLSHALLTGRVMHMRHWPKTNGFRYGMYYLCLPLSALPALNGLRLLSLNRANLWSLREADHINRREPMERWIRDQLARFQLSEADGEVVLLTLPRLMGYAFNPVTFWFCLDRAGALRAVLSEVNNTFGERHCYLSFHDDHRPIVPDDVLESRKVFHVSPFMDRHGHYTFRFVYGEKRIGVWIDLWQDGRNMLSTALTGTRRPLTDGALLRCFWRYPLVTLKVTFLIHYQALRIVLKGIRYRPKPTPLQEVLTR